MSQFFLNPNPTPGSGTSFVDREITLQKPCKRFTLVSRCLQGHLYFHFSPLSKIAANPIAVTGGEPWIPLHAFRTIRFARPISHFFMSGDEGGNTGGGPDFSVLCMDDDLDEITDQGADVDVNIDLQVGAPNFNHNQVTVQNIITQIVPARLTRWGVLIINHGTTDVFIGNGTVSTANGALLPGVKGAAITIPTTEAVSAIVAAGSQVISFVELTE